MHITDIGVRTGMILDIHTKVTLRHWKLPLRIFQIIQTKPHSRIYFNVGPSYSTKLDLNTWCWTYSDAKGRRKFLFLETYLKTGGRWFNHIEHQWRALLFRMWEILAFDSRFHQTAQPYIKITQDFTFLPILHSWLISPLTVNLRRTYQEDKW